MVHRCSGKHLQGVNHCEKFQVVWQVALFCCCRELAALVGHNVVITFVVGLRRCVRIVEMVVSLASDAVRRKQSALARVEVAKDRGRRQAVLKGVEALLFDRAPVPGCVRTTQPGEWGRDSGVAIDEAAVVVAQPDKLAQLDIGWWSLLFPDGCYLMRVHRHPSALDVITQKPQFLAAEGALGGLDVELLLPQDGQNLPDVADMLFQRGTVHVHHNRSIQGPFSPLHAPDRRARV